MEDPAYYDQSYNSEYESGANESASDFFTSSGDGFSGAGNKLLDGAATALGNRIGTFGTDQKPGVVSGAQYQRNPLTGELYRTTAGGAGGMGGLSLTSPVVLLALAGIAALFILKR